MVWKEIDTDSELTDDLCWLTRGLFIMSQWWNQSHKVITDYGLSFFCYIAFSQGLLAAVEKERNLRSRRSAHIIHEDYEINHVSFVVGNVFIFEFLLHHMLI